jgi:hypothetical protein
LTGLEEKETTSPVTQVCTCKHALSSLLLFAAFKKLTFILVFYIFNSIHIDYNLITNTLLLCDSAIYTISIRFTFIQPMGLPLWFCGQRSWLQIQRSRVWLFLRGLRPRSLFAYSTNLYQILAAYTRDFFAAQTHPEYLNDI